MTRSRPFFSIDAAPRKASNRFSVLDGGPSTLNTLAWVAALMAGAACSIAAAFYLNQGVVLPAGLAHPGSIATTAFGTAIPAFANTAVLIALHSALEQRLATDRFLEGIALNGAFALANLNLLPAAERLFRKDPTLCEMLLFFISVAQGLIPFFTTFVWEKHAAMYTYKVKHSSTPAPLSTARKASPYALIMATLGSAYVAWAPRR
ncbi:hypothetical protein S40285_10466 [Stachybotrys chlorohalonatus IBT 40285]|uniref:Uncharacterized protein n=1 Tax=Stachybotrys chlorohalonatus (strain IBT 40285) TaxID=1283841 RepID=A0A084QS54_STAC4|nr:hypothetical protein S40285_10466 [Stachybotrys chlorohalonata IBT 40285]